MLDIRLPESVVGRLSDDGEIARGPFVVVHQGTAKLGGYMRHNDDAVIFWDGSRTLDMDKSFTITGNGTDRVVARSVKYNTSFLFRPLELDDRDWLFDTEEERPNSLSELEYAARDMIANF